MVFVFGSNLAGIHGAGAAKYAHERYGAIMGEGEGHHGNSYALPTKDRHIRTMSLVRIQFDVRKFIQYARQYPELEFKVTRIGCGLAGYTDEQIAPMFKTAPDNCYFDKAWKEWLPNHKSWE